MGNEDKLQELKEKKRIANENYKAKVKINVEKLKNFREKSANQQRQWRTNQAQLQENDTIPVVESIEDRNSSQSMSTVFKSFSSKSKAIKKCENSLPIDVEKRKEIIKYIAKRNDVATIIQPAARIKRPRKGFEEAAKLAI